MMEYSTWKSHLRYQMNDGRQPHGRNGERSGFVDKRQIKLPHCLHPRDLAYSFGFEPTYGLMLPRASFVSAVPEHCSSQEVSLVYCIPCITGEKVSPRQWRDKQAWKRPPRDTTKERRSFGRLMYGVGVYGEKHMDKKISVSS